MNTSITHIVCITLLSSPFVFAGKQEFQLDQPKDSALFYATVADAVYEKHKHKSQKTCDKILGNGVAVVLDHQEHTSTTFGKTNFIVVKSNKTKEITVGIEGSNSIHNWIGNGIAPTIGSVKEFDVPHQTRKEMHDRMKKIAKKYGVISYVVGHSQGGMFASQLLKAKKDSDTYKAARVITFNGFKVKSDPKQLHLAIKNEAAATNCSPKDRYVWLSYGGGMWRVVSNHQLKYFLSHLKDKSWRPNVLD